MDTVNNDIQLQRIGAEHVELLKAIGRKVFVESFSWGNTGDNMQLYLDAAFTDAKLLGEINNPDSLFYFARIKGVAAGYVKINFGKAQTEIQNIHNMELERIYILQEFQGMKVGQFLLDEVLKIGRNRNLQQVWLGVWEKNPRAIRFYERNGFEQFDSHTFRLGNDEQTDIMMRLLL